MSIRCHARVCQRHHNAKPRKTIRNVAAAQGAGIQAGRTVIDMGVEAVVTGAVGPKAMATLQAGGVKVYVGAEGTVAEAVESLKAGRLKCTSEPTVEGHWA